MGIPPVKKELPLAEEKLSEGLPLAEEKLSEGPLAEEKLSEGSFAESLYTRTSAEDLFFGEFGSYILEEPSKICEFTESELELPFEEEVESVYLGSTERLFQDEFPESTKLTPFTVEPAVVTDEVCPQEVLKVPETDLSPVQVTAEEPVVPIVPVGMITAPAILEAPTKLEAPTRVEAAEGYRIERITSSTGELRDEIYYDVLGRTVVDPGAERIIAAVSDMLVEPLEAIKKMEDEIMSEIPAILSELLARCEGPPEGKPELSEVQHVLSEVLAKCAAVGADKQAVMESVITEVMTKGEGGLEAADVHEILKDLLGKCEGTVPGMLEIPDVGLVAGGTETPEVKAILSEVVTKCAGTGKMDASDMARILSEVITSSQLGSQSQVGIQAQIGVQEQPAIAQKLEILPEGAIPDEQQEIKQKRVCTCASSPIYEAAPERAVEEAEPQVLIQDTEVTAVQDGRPEYEAGVMPIAAVSDSDASFEYNEDSYSRVTAAEFPFGETGSCILEPPKEYGFTDSELELPFEEEEPIVELGPDERLFQNEFTGVVTATHKPLTITTETAEETTVPKEVSVPLEEQEEETFFEAVGEPLPEEKFIGEIVLEDERREDEIEGDLETQMASLRQRVSKKSKEIIEIKTLLSQLQQQQSLLGGKIGVEPSKFPEMVMAEEDYTRPIALGPGARPSASELQAAIASLQDKCRVKDHMIGAMVEELRARAQSGIWNELKTRIASPEMPQPDYTRSQVVDYLTPDATFPQILPESTGPCSCSGDAKPTSMAVSLPPANEERACVASPPLSLQVPVSTCTCPGDFKIVRKIGADSLLLGWQVPATSANLSGYDIYVNGVLQCKVWSGTRNRALIHCLDLSTPMVILLYGRTTSGQLSGPARITYSGET